MMTAIVFLIGMAVLIAAVLVLAAFSGRMSKGRRALIVRLAVLLFYPVCCLVSVHSAWSTFASGNWLVAGLNGFVVLGMTVAGIQIWRNPSLRPGDLKDAK